MARWACRAQFSLFSPSCPRSPPFPHFLSPCRGTPRRQQPARGPPRWQGLGSLGWWREGCLGNIDLDAGRPPLCFTVGVQCIADHSCFVQTSRTCEVPQLSTTTRPWCMHSFREPFGSILWGWVMELKGSSTPRKQCLSVSFECTKQSDQHTTCRSVNDDHAPPRPLWLEVHAYLDGYSYSSWRLPDHLIVGGICGAWSEDFGALGVLLKRCQVHPACVAHTGSAMCVCSAPMMVHLRTAFRLDLQLPPLPPPTQPTPLPTIPGIVSPKPQWHSSRAQQGRVQGVSHEFPDSSGFTTQLNPVFSDVSSLARLPQALAP